MPGDEGLSLPADGSLADALSALKRAGSNLLVVGTVTGDASAGACRRLLGGDDTDRRRLLVFTDACGDRVTERLPCGATDDAVTVIDGTEPSRSGSAGTGAPSAPGTASPASTDAPDGPSMAGTGTVANRRVDATDLAVLGNAVVEALEEVEADADALEPAGLRLCVDSLLPLLAANDEEAVFRFLHVLTGRVRQLRGMGHYHLPVTPDDGVAQRLTPLFDAVVELRDQDGAAQQRWHVRDADVSSDWLPV